MCVFALLPNGSQIPGKLELVSSDPLSSSDP